MSCVFLFCMQVVEDVAMTISATADAGVLHQDISEANVVHHLGRGMLIDFQVMSNAVGQSKR